MGFLNYQQYQRNQGRTKLSPIDVKMVIDNGSTHAISKMLLQGYITKTMNYWKAHPFFTEKKMCMGGSVYDIGLFIKHKSLKIDLQNETSQKFDDVCCKSTLFLDVLLKQRLCVASCWKIEVDGSVATPKVLRIDAVRRKGHRKDV